MLHFSFFQKSACSGSCETKNGYCCEFPFKYNSIEYNSCTTVRDYDHWCAYGVDGSNNMVTSGGHHWGGKWDYCKDNCKDTDFKGKYKNVHNDNYKQNVNIINVLFDLNYKF